MQETWVPILGQERPGEGVASISAWKISWTGASQAIVHGIAKS